MVYDLQHSIDPMLALNHTLNTHATGFMGVKP
jgi:hypothetical protein